MKILRLRAVLEKLGISKATVYRWIRTEDFPAPIHLGPRAVGWSEASINKWLAGRQRKKYC
jgi:prophage regulatory protein